ncbi:DUF5320 domain-containing protein [uncultured Sphaerochaeta sp.]|uniref:DUF5320 domain-containing protein n=1 Tax=uncultured Sphaerochaeta sp. TaxID=886478 RepID=UPI002A0A3054|nr:DUF5320 domain-containing protein [uncultured Sphaerochaeta sp.]
MPARDGSGPRGLGPMRGNGLGMCNSQMERRGRSGHGFGPRQCSASRNTVQLLEQKKILEQRLQILEEKLENR